MLPVIFDPTKLRVGLAGEGAGLARRRTMLKEAGVDPVDVTADEETALEGLHCLYIAGLDPESARRLAERARTRGVAVNVEDEPALCDFHVPAIVRRGDLLLTVSSAGRAPGLTSAIREWLAARFGGEWAFRLDEVARRRNRWRAESVPSAEISARTRAIASGWLP